MMLHGGFRVVANEFRSSMELLETTVCRVAPVEESLRAGSPCALLTSAMRLSGHGKDLILCGQSFGATVAWTLAMRLATCGLEIRVIVSMDCRSISITSLDVAFAIPRSLLESLAPKHVRLALVARCLCAGRGSFRTLTTLGHSTLHPALHPQAQALQEAEAAFGGSKLYLTARYCKNPRGPEKCSAFGAPSKLQLPSATTCFRICFQLWARRSRMPTSHGDLTADTTTSC
ncbi:ANXA6 [Symbiodinium natans]|uniref:ANXA6 protein n=1 Tax=Symbiodinium natans TaxID=878477 RepID=A0A812RVI7_9DINO|nr:ANXA6 [Symbiodinium natans]